MTILTIAQTCCNRLQITAPTSSFPTSTDNNFILLKALMEEVGRAIRDEYPWPELTKQHAFNLLNGVDAYPLPGDYDRTLSETWWNRTQRWPLIGPMTAQDWQLYKSGLITTLPRQRFRPKYWATNQFFIDPTPTSDENNQLCVYEYISQSIFRPANWIANTAYTTSSYVSSNGIILKGQTNGTSANNGQSPQWGTDNTVVWDPIPDYVASQVYYEGQYVYANSKVYQVTTQGLSSAGTPSVASGSETLGTVVFEFQSNASAWVGGTAYAVGDFSSANSHAYRCTVAGTSGRVSPKFYVVYGAVTTATGVVAPAVTTKRVADGTAVWDVYESPYITINADADECILDNDMFTDQVVWRFKQERGLDFEDLRRQAEEGKETSKTKLSGSQVLNYNSRSGYPPVLNLGNYPEGNF